MDYSRRRLPGSSRIRNVSQAVLGPKKIRGVNREKNLQHKYVFFANWQAEIYIKIYIYYIIYTCFYLTFLAEIHDNTVLQLLIPAIVK